MLKVDAAGMQVDVPVLIGMLEAVLHIAPDRAADMAQLCPDLVGAASKQLHLQQPVIIELAHHAVA